MRRLLTDITFDSKLLWDFVQTNQGRVADISQNVGEDAGGFGAVMETTENHQAQSTSCLSGDTDTFDDPDTQNAFSYFSL